jgi:hypothetical protein
MHVAHERRRRRVRFQCWQVALQTSDSEIGRVAAPSMAPGGATELGHYVMILRTKEQIYISHNVTHGKNVEALYEIRLTFFLTMHVFSNSFLSSHVFDHRMFYGHDESSSSMKSGNFLEILEW